ncbi:hypothetical protein WA538_002019 [Blastocystis sp. DL]
MNKPDPSLAVRMDLGMRKVTQVTETKISNACKYIIETEDHTLGNVMRMDMLNDPKVTFVGYRVPHPLATNIEMRVQTSDPAYPPGRAMMESCSRIISLCKELNDDVLNFEQKRSKEMEDHVFYSVSYRKQA